MEAGASLETLQHLYEERYRDYLRVAAAVTGSLESGRDAVHDAFVGVVRSRDSFRSESPVAGWVWRSVVNAALKRRRDDHSGRDLPIEAVAEMASATDSGWEQRMDVLAAVAALPERQRLVLFLRYYADLDYDSIATALDIRSGTVGATLHAAQTALRNSFKEVPAR